MGGKLEHAARARSMARTISALLILVCGTLWWNLPRFVAGIDNAPSWHESPGFFPAASMFIIIFGGLAHLWHHRRLENDAVGEDEINASTSRTAPALLSLIAILIYAAVVPVIGYAAATLFFVSAMLLCAGLRWRAALLAGLAAAALLHAVFVLAFHIWFQEPSILTLLGKGAGP